MLMSLIKAVTSFVPKTPFARAVKTPTGSAGALLLFLGIASTLIVPKSLLFMPAVMISAGTLLLTTPALSHVLAALGEAREAKRKNDIASAQLAAGRTAESTDTLLAYCSSNKDQIKGSYRLCAFAMTCGLGLVAAAVAMHLEGGSITLASVTGIAGLFPTFLSGSYFLLAKHASDRADRLLPILVATQQVSLMGSDSDSEQKQARRKIVDTMMSAYVATVTPSAPRTSETSPSERPPLRIAQ